MDSVQEKKIASFPISNVDLEQAVQAFLWDFFWLREEQNSRLLRRFAVTSEKRNQLVTSAKREGPREGKEIRQNVYPSFTFASSLAHPLIFSSERCLGMR